MRDLKNQQIANQNYNRERSQISKWLRQDINHDKVIREIHEQSTNRIQQQIDSFYLRYGNREGLTAKEMRKKADNFDVTQYFEKARIAVENKDFTPEANEWLRTYNLKMQTSRLEVLKANINLELLDMYSKDQRFIDSELHKSAAEEYNRQKEIIEQYQDQAGILGNSAVSPSKSLTQLVYADFYGANFSERIWGRNGHYQSLQRDLFKSLANIKTDMMGYRAERNRLMDKYQTTEYEAMRLLRTETQRINADVQLEMGKRNGFTHMIYVAEPSACSVCAALDTSKIPIDKVEPGYNMFPMHPNCRCSAYGHVEMMRSDGTSTLDDI